MTANMCQETLNVEDVVYFGDIEDVLRKSVEREKSTGGTIIFNSISGCNFAAGEYNMFYINKHTIIMCLNTVDPLKVHNYMLRTNCLNFGEPHLINRYDWKRTCCDWYTTPAEMKRDFAENGIQVEEGLLAKLKDTLGERFCNWTYVVRGNANLNGISEQDITLIKVEPQSEDSPKGIYVMKNPHDGSVIGFICKVELIGDYEYGALLEDPNVGHFAFIYSDEHIYNSVDKTPEELPDRFTGLVNIKDFLKP